MSSGFQSIFAVLGIFGVSWITVLAIANSPAFAEFVNLDANQSGIRSTCDRSFE